MKIIIALLASVVACVASIPVNDTATSPSSFKLTIGNGEQEITIDENRNTEVYVTSGSDDAVIIKDFNQRLEVIVPKTGERCFVRPLRASRNVDPSKLKKDLKHAIDEGVEPQLGDTSEEHLTVDNVPIKSNCFGEIITEKCEGRNIYWMEPVPHGDAEMMKRALDCYYYTYCDYTYIGFGWWSYGVSVGL
ncbi:uncharacterized protein LOC102803396 [Saccoglossus kowalevskii]|uniref:Integral membrane protein 2 n=1 Tax=Saccoglossus kowalevskii TaxID=10224 RepID=A0ABM0MTR9_SACKO|nr:PREDICTED: uncharacterized protein LOC102803396 [Saccoglossus kowalevskii]